MPATVVTTRYGALETSTKKATVKRVANNLGARKPKRGK